MNKYKNKRLFVLVAAAIFMGLIFYNSFEFYNKKNIAQNTTNNIKDMLPKPATNAIMNERESKVNSKGIPNDLSSIDVYKPNGHKIAYLTFDDGPSPKITPSILKILDNYNIKATFFLIGSMAIKNPDIVRSEVKDGQSIGNHTYSHDYKYIYSNANNFITDINKCDATLKSIIGNGYTSKLLRFPGGSFGNKRIELRESIKVAGYHYFDWNDLTGDSEQKNVPVNKLLTNLKKNTKGKEHVVILMHDAGDKETTVEALPMVVEYLKSEGYSFSTLS